MTDTPDAPCPTLDQEAIRLHFHAAVARRTPLALWTAVADIPVMLAELHRLTTLLTWARMEFANLLASARATIGAHEDGEPHPLAYLRNGIAAYEPIDLDSEDDLR